MPSRFKSKKQIVYDQLRQEIIEGVHPPGTRLIIDEQASRLGVSQIPIREAVHQLESDGFVVIIQHVGATVTGLDAKFIYEIFALLESMEVICCRTACQTITDDQLETLGQFIIDMEEHLQDLHRWSEQNKAMHLFLCDVARTDLVRKMMLKVFDHWERLRYRYLTDVFGHRVEEAHDEHKQILEALRQRDPDRVEDIVRLHNQSALQSYIRYLQSAGHLAAE